MARSGLRRVPSGLANGAEPNPNVEWFGQHGFYIYYGILIGIGRVFFGFLSSLFKIFGPPYTWTWVHIVHTVVSFILLHWLKGAPFWIPEDQGRYDSETFWEQIDDGRQYTLNRKIMTAIPVIIFVIASWNLQYTDIAFVINVVCLAFETIGKTGVMHHVRIGGINK